MNRGDIMIIEDDPALLKGLKDNFIAKGYEVRTAADGEKGLQMVLENRPDLLLLDIMLPKINGYEICRAIRLNKIEIPIIMLTARSQEEEVVKGLDLGADDYVTKPFSIRELLARTQAFLRRGKQNALEFYEFGDCKLDLAAHKLFKGTSEIVLTSKEFQLLHFFLQNPGRALTRNLIMNHVWGDDIIVTARSVDRCVTTLRAKIESNPAAPAHIQTIRDVGYRFDPICR